MHIHTKHYRPRILLWLLLAAAVPRSIALAGPAGEGKELQFLGLVTHVPKVWNQAAPSSSMRLAQFATQDEAGKQTAELIFYYFGPGQGGSAEANIARWRSQFHRADGTLPEPRISKLSPSGLPITRVRLQGSYARGIGAGPGGTGKPDQTLVAALLQTHKGLVTIQLHGDTVLVDTLEAGFDAMLDAIKPLDGD